MVVDEVNVSFENVAEPHVFIFRIFFLYVFRVFFPHFF